jgi:spore coat protein U-like protein
MQVKNFIAAAAVAALGFGVVGGAQAAASPNSPATAQFQVTMTITSACAVTTLPTDINLGSVVAQSAAVSQTGSNTFKVNCSKGTAFNIGLAPSTANGGTNTGTGNMVSTTAPLTNTDKVPYTLYSDSAYSVVWGNTATSGSVGNGKSGTGAGMAGTAVSFTAYAKAANSDFTPDSYADTVTVNVNY